MHAFTSAGHEPTLLHLHHPTICLTAPLLDVPYTDQSDYMNNTWILSTTGPRCPNVSPNLTFSRTVVPRYNRSTWAKATTQQLISYISSSSVMKLQSAAILPPVETPCLMGVEWTSLFCVTRTLHKQGWYSTVVACGVTDFSHLLVVEKKNHTLSCAKPYKTQFSEINDTGASAF